ncbi:hypothetical protein [Paenibacillus lutimineralis]|uniref:HNH endonuclease n=1 Tax=Paenibacillus lutimineralis TaxID=2707005 RepID=A0A3S9UWH2_9BACL|nr:hypothetical protein [Paenibacillus lutimineralis]AZS14676.1 hypothetical protein EI981_09555 [Paenibacillus lutimineralis]
MKGVRYFIIIPVDVLKTILSMKDTLNIGVTDAQREKWSALGVKYEPLVKNPWNINNAVLSATKDLTIGWIDMCLSFDKEEKKVLSKFGIPETCWFSIRSSVTEGEHYIGLGKYGSSAYHQHGIWYQVIKRSKSLVLQPTFINTKGQRVKVEWPEIKISYSNVSKIPLLTIRRAIEAGWLTSNILLQDSDFEAPKPPDEPFDWDLDGRAMKNYRKEQNELRSMLLNGLQEARCAICGEVFPADMLWAAHIKKRSECTPEEKSDLLNIAVLMCKLGCDDLYEKGYIGVNQGVVRSIRSTSSNALSKKIVELQGTSTDSWNERNAKYFKWHWRYFNPGTTD